MSTTLGQDDTGWGRLDGDPAGGATATVAGPASTVRSAAPGAAPSPRTRTGLAVLAAGVASGVAGDALLRAAPWGLNLALWTALACAAVWGVRRWTGWRTVEGTWLVALAGLGALMAGRDSPVLKGATLVALGAVLALAVYRAQGGRVRLGGAGGYLLAGLRTVGDAAVGGAVLLGREIRWNELPRDGWSRHAGATLRGGAIALPLLLLFGGLLASADAVFGELLDDVFHFDVPLVLSHLLLAAALAWMSAGVMRALFLDDAVGAPEVVRPAALSLGTTETVTVLGSLNLLFGVFVAVQLRYLFGGAEQVTVPGSTLSYADYARGGFFELVTVAGLMLPLLLGLHWLLRGGAAQERAFRWLAGVQLALLAVIMVSAMRRMWLYQGAYGLTELRLYTSAFMAWLAIVFAWFAATVLRGRREQFAFGALLAGVATLAGLHAANPDALIVRVNAARADSAVRFDVGYASGLSGDAVPALLATLPRLDEAARCQGATLLLRSWTGGEGDWRSWSWGRSGAVAAVAAREAELRGVCARARVAGTPLDVETTTTYAATIPTSVDRTAAAGGPGQPSAGEWTQSATLHSLTRAGVSVSVERQRGHPTRAGYHRRIVLRGGGSGQEAAMAFDTDGPTGINVYMLGDDTYLLRDAGESYVVDLGQRLVLRHATRAPVHGQYLGAFDVGANESWHFIPAAQRPEKPTEPRGG